MIEVLRPGEEPRPFDRLTWGEVAATVGGPIEIVRLRNDEGLPAGALLVNEEARFSDLTMNVEATARARSGGRPMAILGPAVFVPEHHQLLVSDEEDEGCDACQAHAHMVERENADLRTALATLREQAGKDAARTARLEEQLRMENGVMLEAAEALRMLLEVPDLANAERFTARVRHLVEELGDVRTRRQALADGGR